MPLPPVPMPRRFDGRSVVVTGAGTGFGAEIAVRAAQEGARVVGVHYRSSAAGAEATAERVRAEGAEAVLLQADIVEWAQVAAMADAAFEAIGRRRRADQQRRRRGPRADVVARHHRGVHRPRARRRHQGHDGLHPRVREADARPGPRQHRQHRLDRDRARQRPRPAVRRGEVRPARRHQVLRPRLRPDRAGQHLRARLHRDRGDAGPQGLAVRPRRPAARR